MDAKELHEQIRYWRNVANGGRSSSMTEALHGACDHLESYASLLASVEGSSEEIVRELREQVAIARCAWGHELPIAKAGDKAAAALVAERAAKEKAEAERDELKRHAEAMATHLNDGIQVDVDPEDGTQSPRSEWDFVANELVAAYRAAHPKDAP